MGESLNPNSIKTLKPNAYTCLKIETWGGPHEFPPMKTCEQKVLGSTLILLRLMVHM